MRLSELARQTKDTYLPRIRSKMLQFVGDEYAGPDRSLNSSTSSPTDPVYSLVPHDTQLVLYPLYTTFSHESETFRVHVKGWVYIPGVMNRKNRLILSLVRQIIRGLSAAVDQLAVSSAVPETTKIDTDDVLIHSDSSTGSENSLSTSSAAATANVGPETASGSDTQNALIKERISGFLAKSLANIQLTITVGSENPKVSTLVVQDVVTDNLGAFNVTLEVPYVPLAVQVAAKEDESVCCIRDVMFIEDGGIGIISDIDDTVKLTGVTKDKRELFRLLLLGDVLLWYIPSVVRWYLNLFGQNPNLSFHYVSNSPWQLFPVILSYFSFAKLPPGSVHLKQYSGNIIGLLMEPLVLRKKQSLDRIVDDFPSKKFVCVGDSGEHDLEAYVNVTSTHPHSVLAICIRVVAGTLSDHDDDRILKEGRRIIEQFDLEKSAKSNSNSKSNSGSNSNFNSGSNSGSNFNSNSGSDLIDLDGKAPPPVPKKPDFLRSEPSRKPPLPERPKQPIPQHAYTDPLVEDVISNHNHQHPYMLPKRLQTVPNLEETSTPASLQRRKTANSLVLNSMKNIYNAETLYELEQIDKKGAEWLTRVCEACELLVDTPTKIVFFKDDDDWLLEKCTKLVHDSIR